MTSNGERDIRADLLFRLREIADAFSERQMFDERDAVLDAADRIEAMRPYDKGGIVPPGPSMVRLGRVVADPEACIYCGRRHLGVELDDCPPKPDGEDSNR